MLQASVDALTIDVSRPSSCGDPSERGDNLSFHACIWDAVSERARLLGQVDPKRAELEKLQKMLHLLEMQKELAALEAQKAALNNSATAPSVTCEMLATKVES